jgi:DNA-binding transcriptional LysR family regulator
MRERDVVSGMAVFVAVVEGGSLAAAARSTGLTPSAVSKLVARLERDFGSALLRRTTRRMSVTDAGRTYYERARAILEDLRSVEEQMASHGSTPRGLLRVSAPQLLGQTRVLPILLAFLDKAPAVSLDLDVTDRRVDMVRERVDIAVRITSEPPSGFVARNVGSVRRVLCASPTYLRGRSAPRVPHDLGEHACLALGGPDTSDVWTFGEAAESVRITARVRVNTTLALQEAAKAGLGIADLPRYLVEDDLRARQLIPVLEGFEPLQRGVFVIYSAGSLIPLRAREASKHLVTELRKVLGWSSRTPS